MSPVSVPILKEKCSFQILLWISPLGGWQKRTCHHCRAALFEIDRISPIAYTDLPQYVRDVMLKITWLLHDSRLDNPGPVRLLMAAKTFCAIPNKAPEDVIFSSNEASATQLLGFFKKMPDVFWDC